MTAVAVAAFPILETTELDLDPADLVGLDLGLTSCTRSARWTTVLRPFVLTAVFAVAIVRGWWPIGLAVFPFLFVSQVVALNDLMHESLGFGPRVNDRLLTLVGLLVFESGHAIRSSHLAHHEQCGGATDPESYVDQLDGLPLARAVPQYRFRIWLWGLRHARADRGVMLREMSVSCVATIAAVVGIGRWPGFTLYAVLSTLACWSFPLVSARGPQTAWGRHRSSHAVLVRGRFLPRVLLNLTHHMEHHLFPDVPSYRLPELAARLEPLFTTAGVRRIEVW